MGLARVNLVLVQVAARVQLPALAQGLAQRRVPPAWTGAIYLPRGWQGVFPQSGSHPPPMEFEKHYNRKAFGLLGSFLTPSTQRQIHAQLQKLGTLMGAKEQQLH